MCTETDLSSDNALTQLPALGISDLPIWQLHLSQPGAQPESELL